MKFENTEVMNFEGALRGMRNPLNSWAKSDSFFGITCEHEGDYNVDEVADAWVEAETKDLVESDRDIDEIRDELYDKKTEKSPKKNSDCHCCICYRLHRFLPAAG